MAPTACHSTGPLSSCQDNPQRSNTYLLTVTCVFAGRRDARMVLRSVGRRLLLRTHTPGPVLAETSSGQASALTFWIGA